MCGDSEAGPSPCALEHQGEGDDVVARVEECPDVYGAARYRAVCSVRELDRMDRAHVRHARDTRAHERYHLGRRRMSGGLPPRRG